MFQHHRSLEAVSIENGWLTIGVFDGVHRGHQEIVRQLTAGAHANGAPAVLLTFSPHPALVLGGVEIKCLTTPDERANLLADMGVDVVITYPFDKQTAALSPEEFMARLKEHTDLKKLFVGYDFSMGRNRAGNPARLTEIGYDLGYDVLPIAALQLDGQIVSSTLIRQQIGEGDVAGAAVRLGRNYMVSGAVIRGDGRGRTIGIPTANLDVPIERPSPPTASTLVGHGLVVKSIKPSSILVCGPRLIMARLPRASKPTCSITTPISMIKLSVLNSSSGCVANKNSRGLKRW